MKECPKCEVCYPDEVGICPADGMQTRHSLPGGTLIASRYMLEKRLGRGAMGQVYLAKDNKFATRNVAVKTVRQDVLSSDDLQEGEAIARFEREAQAAASIQHPNTVSVTDFGETEDGVFYLVMEFVDGETLHKLLRREGTLPVKRAVRMLRQIADGVDAAHDIGILHRDLKPANIFLMRSAKGGDGFIKVGDFGLAKIVSQTVTDFSSHASPSSRGIIGTPEFMSPEQMQPEMGVDVRADIYALGTIAYLMLGGKTPFTGDMMQLVMQKIMHKPPPLSSLRSDVPLAVERVIMRSLEIDPNLRPSTVTQWISELENAAEGVEDANRPGRPRLVVMAPVNSEVYIDDERKGSVGSSGRVVLSDVPIGNHVLRVSKAGERDDERVIEIRDGANEQVIQAQLRPMREQGSQPSPSQGSSSGGIHSSVMPGIVACTKCNSRFAEGAKFCGRCGNRSFVLISPGDSPGSFPCPRCSTALPANSRFCGRCGLNITPPSQTSIPRTQTLPPQAERICRRCGSAYPPNIKFCGRCGGSMF
ncbi:MAG TPA: protein kinase [Pyrinomonadaceae bacterium]|jgi:serine/threonine protein kinase|nr:protein kinase [Pyrinomonadaceae bacterium]